MAGPPACRLEDGVGRALYAVPRPQEQSRIEVPLDAAVRPDLLPALAERDAPVEADDVAARGRHRLEQVRRAGPEVDRRHREPAEDPLEYGATNSS